MQILLIMLIVVLLAFSVLLLALAKQSPREKQTEDKEQEEYIRDYAETVRQTGGSMKKLEHWKVIAIYLIIYDMIAVNFSYFMALLVRFDFRYSSIPTDYFAAWRSFAPIYTIIILAVFGCMHLYNSVWRFASFHELIKITVATVITGVLHIVGITIFWERMPASYYLIGIMLQFFLTVGVRFSYRFVLLERNRREKSEREERSKNVMIIGAGEAGRTIVRELQNAKETNSRVRCLIDDNPNKWGRYMEGVPVVGGRDDIFLNVDKYHINQILLAIPTATPHQKRDILNICKETGCELKQLPGVYQLVNGEVSLSKMKKVAVEDLLGRDTIKVNMSEIFQYLKGKRILVTGGGGSIGSELCRQIAGHEPELLVIFDIYENNAYDIEQELKASYPNLNLKVLIGSVRDSKRINWVFETYKPEIVYHAAAHKHVPLMENSPCEAIKNNVVGTYKTAYAAMMNGCQRFVLISTDTGSSGGCFLTDDEEAANKVRKWSTQARENAAWYQHEELGYNYRMSNVVAGVVRGQFPYLNEHIAQKKAIYERYKEGLKGLPVSMNPMNLENSEPNYWLSCLIIDKEAMCKQVRGEQDVCYIKETGKTCPTEILEAIASINAEGRPVWKPMHMQPIYRLNPFVVKDGNGRARSNAYIAGSVSDVGMDIFNRGLCLPSDNKMTVEQQERIIEVIRACFE